MLCLVARCRDDVHTFPLPGTRARLGSSGENDIVLGAPGVSRYHALMTRVAEGVQLTDLGSKNGLLVDGKRVESVLLAPGKSVQLGHALVSIEDRETEDVLPALVAIGRGDRDEPSTASFTRTRAGRGALRLIARIERLGGSAVQRAQTILEPSREVLNATSLFLLDGDAIVAGAGPLLRDAALHEIARAANARRKGEEEIRRIGETSLLFSWSARRALVAAYEGSPRIVSEDERAFFSYLATRLLRPREEGEALALPRAHDLVAVSEAMQSLVRSAEALADARRPVLLIGETGCGKEVLAHVLHQSSSRARRPFRAFSCAELPRELIEPELFGIEAGVATGVAQRDGIFASMDGGTLLLDEVGELTDSQQAALLRVLETSEIRPVGARVPRQIDVRVILATRRDLGVLREDLYYRCHVLRVPPLRGRRDDIVPLALRFLERACNELGIARAAISRKAVELLLAHDWPGNVRELESSIERAVALFGRGGTLHADHFALRPPSTDVELPIASLEEHCNAVEREQIRDALAKTRGNKSAAARLLQVSRNGLQKKMERYGL